jgi:hypothetical protein
MAALVVVTIRTSGGFKIMSFGVHSVYLGVHTARTQTWIVHSGAETLTLGGTFDPTAEGVVANRVYHGRSGDMVQVQSRGADGRTAGAKALARLGYYESLEMPDGSVEPTSSLHRRYDITYQPEGVEEWEKT